MSKTQYRHASKVARRPAISQTNTFLYSKNTEFFGEEDDKQPAKNSPVRLHISHWILLLTRIHFKLNNFPKLRAN